MSLDFLTIILAVFGLSTRISSAYLHWRRRRPLLTGLELFRASFFKRAYCCLCRVTINKITKIETWVMAFSHSGSAHFLKAECVWNCLFPILGSLSEWHWHPLSLPCFPLDSCIVLNYWAVICFVPLPCLQVLPSLAAAFVMWRKLFTVLSQCLLHCAAALMGLFCGLLIGWALFQFWCLTHCL